MSVNATEARSSFPVQRRVRANPPPTSCIRVHGSDVNKRLDRGDPSWMPNAVNTQKREADPGCAAHVSALSRFWSANAARLLRVWRTNQHRFAAAPTDGREVKKASEQEQHAGRTVKETVPHGRDVTQQQRPTVTTQRPSGADARLYSSATFSSAKHTRVCVNSWGLNQADTAGGSLAKLPL